MTEIIEIDGSCGEGGGQILRSSLTMSLLTGHPFTMNNIRIKRKNPGLAPQHLTAIHAAAQISGSRVEGAVLKSQQIKFFPGKTSPGNYFFKVDTAGAMPLVLHTVFLPLALAGDGTARFHGGTHVSWAPCYEYLQEIWGETLRQLGFDLQGKIERAGYYPKGGGAFQFEISHAVDYRPLELLERPPLEKLELTCILSNLPEHIAEREFATVQQQMAQLALPVPITTILKKYPSPGAGNVLFLQAKFAGARAGFTSLGKRGLSAEKVAQNLVDEFLGYWQSQAPIDEHLADQLLLPLILAPGVSNYRVAKVSQHLLTNALIIGRFADAKIEISGEEGQTGQVTIKPGSIPAF